LPTTLNSDFEIFFSNLGHPFNDANTKVNNDVVFIQNHLILTGSNMSGKIAAGLGSIWFSGMGSVVCASEANVHPSTYFSFHATMDSLSDSESYFFFAEIKRLKQIMDELEESGFCFVDEILRY
jgi:DNA mismatch repair ATPase MutS